MKQTLTIEEARRQAQQYQRNKKLKAKLKQIETNPATTIKHYYANLFAQVNNK